MRFQRVVLIGLITLFLNLIFANTDTGDQLLEAAAKAYQDGDYATAVQRYETLVAEYPYSADLHFNLGNAYFRSEAYGRAILHLERAALYAPRDKDIRHNLALVRDQLTDQIEILPDFFVTRWWNSLRAALRPTGWGILGLLFLWAGIAGLLLWQRGKERKLRKQGFVIGILLLLFSILPFSLGYSALQHLKNPALAVIMQQEAAMRSAPDPASEQLFLLHEGTSMEIIDQIGDWYKIRLSNGEEGWMKTDVVEQV